MCLSACQFDGFPRNQWWAADEKSGLAARSREPNPSVETQNLEKPSRESSCFTQEMLWKYHKYYSCCGLIQYFHSIFPINAINIIWKNRQLFSGISIYFHSISIVFSSISDELSSISIVFPKSQPFRQKMPRHVSRPVWARPAGYGASAGPRRLESVTVRGAI